MTTTPVMSITDEQIAEIEDYCAAKHGEGFAMAHNLKLSEILGMISRLRAAEKDAERYRALQKVTPYRFKKIQDACITDGGDVFYFHADRFDGLLDAAMEQSE